MVTEERGGEIVLALLKIAAERLSLISSTFLESNPQMRPRFSARGSKRPCDTQLTLSSLSVQNSSRAMRGRIVGLPGQMGEERRRVNGESTCVCDDDSRRKIKKNAAVEKKIQSRAEQPNGYSIREN